MPAESRQPLFRFRISGRRPVNTVNKHSSNSADNPINKEMTASAPILAKHIMTPTDITVSEELKITDLVKLLRENKIGGLPVFRNEKMIGIVTVADVFKAFQIVQWMHLGKLLQYAKLIDIGKKMIRVKDIYQRSTASFLPESPIEQVLECMVAHDLYTLPVMDEKKSVVYGVIGRHDVTWAIFGFQ